MKAISKINTLDWTKIASLYKEGYGTSYIAQQFGTASNTIRRGLIKRGVEIRSKSDAQKLALESGRVTHPTEGTHRSSETKRKLALTSHNTWENLSEEEKNKIRERSKKNWDSRTDEQKKEISSKAAAAIRKASDEGSALEKYLLNKIREQRWNVEMHVTNVLENEKLEIDLVLPDIKTAIEVDGPFHSQVVFSKTQFIKTINSDRTKNGLLIKNGYCLIRIKNTRKNTSNYLFEQLWLQLKPVVESIYKQFPSKIEDRFFELELV